MRRQQMMLGRADICTIDAFCIKLLRRQFRALDIPPDFTTGDEGGLLTLREQAMADTLEATYRQRNLALCGPSRPKPVRIRRRRSHRPLLIFCAPWTTAQLAASRRRGKRRSAGATEVCRAQARWAVRGARQADESLAYAQTLCTQAQLEGFDAVQKAYIALTQERGAGQRDGPV